RELVGADRSPPGRKVDHVARELGACRVGTHAVRAVEHGWPRTRTQANDAEAAWPTDAQRASVKQHVRPGQRTCSGGRPRGPEHGGASKPTWVPVLPGWKDPSL